MTHTMRFIRGAGLVLAALVTRLVPAAAQQTAAAQYLGRYNEVVRIAPTGRVAQVTNLVLEREAGRLTLDSGRLVQLSPVGGRTVGVVFQGRGRFAFAPTLAVEGAELARHLDGAATLDEPITDAVLLFSDSTVHQIARLEFAPGPVPGDAAERARDVVNSLKGEHDGSFDSDVLAPLLNGDNSGFFLAVVSRPRGDPLRFQVNPVLRESVQLLRSVSRSQWGSPWAVVAQFPPRQPLPFSDHAWRERERLDIPRYRMDVRINEALSGDLGLGAAATVSLVAREPIGPWLLFRLAARLDLDSVRLATGDSAAFFKADDDGDAWVHVGRRLAPGDSLSVTLHYHGSMIDRFDNWFFVDPSAAWYPVNGQGRTMALFDLTYQSPARYPLASVGAKLDSSVTGRVSTTRWLTQRPSQFASFSLGLFDIYRMRQPDVAPVDVMISEDAHRLMRRQLASAGIMMSEQANMREAVGADVANSLKLFTHWLGEPLQNHFYVTETPYGHGVSFPGLIHLSWSTFQNTSMEGFDEFFRAHEVAHQWWGNGVRPATYRDAWLAEGMADFFGLWYLQSVRRRDDEYNRFLDRYRSDINSNRNAGPIWIGYRASTPQAPRAYQTMVYQKGAWVMHMLRIMMTDLRTMGTDRFTEMLRDYYQTHRGQAASTADFQRVVERHMGVSMDWFFEQWVRGTALPTYHVAHRIEAAEGGRYLVRFRVRQENVPAGFRMPVLVSVDLGERRIARFRLTITGGQTEYTSPPIPGEPKEVAFNDLHSTLAEVRTARW